MRGRGARVGLKQGAVARGDVLGIVRCEVTAQTRSNGAVVRTSWFGLFETFCALPSLLGLLSKQCA